MMEAAALMVTAIVAGVGVVAGFGVAWWLRSRQARAETGAVSDRLTAEKQSELARAAQDQAFADRRLSEAQAASEQLRQQLASVTATRDRLQADTARLESVVGARAERIGELGAERDRLRDEARSLRETLSSTQSDLRTRTAEFEAQRKGLNEKIELLQNAEKQLSQQFENIANRIFENKSENFRKASGEQITHLLTPFREQIDGLHKDVREASKERHTLSREIERIVTETNALTNALKGDSKRQGDWGELVLERILENSGLRKGHEYEVQTSYSVNTDEGGGRLRPDVIVHLPEERDIVIDSKVSLTAYEVYVNSDDEAERAIHLKAHVQSVRRHIEQLATKRYDHIEAIRTLDYTLMWVPIEPAYFVAMQAEPGLINFAMEKRVVPICATTLFAVLKTIERIWQYERQNNNVQAIIDRASKLYDKFVNFTDAMDKLSTHLDRAQTSYRGARGLLLDGPGNVVRQIEQLREMGLTPKKRLPGEWVESAGALEAPDDDGRDNPGSPSNPDTDASTG